MTGGGSEGPASCITIPACSCRSGTGQTRWSGVSKFSSSVSFSSSSSGVSSAFTHCFWSIQVKSLPLKNVTITCVNSRPMFSMTGDTPLLKSFTSSSAFQPPSSLARDKSSSLFSPGHNLFPRMSPSSSRSSPSPVTHLKTDENSNNDPRLHLSSPDDQDNVTKLGDEEDERAQKREYFVFD